MRTILLFLFSAGLSSNCLAQSRLQVFPLSSVQVLESPFRQAQQTDLKYMLALDPDRLLAPFLREAGIATTAKTYGNWENTGLDGHIGGHYVSALANMYAATKNAEVYRRLVYMIDWLDSCQQKNGDGYVGGVPGGKATWQEINQGKIEAAPFSLNGKWVPLYNIHKTYAGLRDAWMLAGIEKSKKAFLKYCDWFYQLTAGLSDEQFQKLLRSEHGGMNEIFADAAEISGDKKFLELSKKLSHRFILEPLLHQKDALTGLHANTQIPKVIGFMQIGLLTGDTAWQNAAEFFWNTVVKNRSVSIGGNSVREHFNAPDNFSLMLESREGPETCNTYNMLRLTRNLFLAHPKAHYLDYYERSLYNHILSSQHPGGGFVYFTPIRPAHYRVYSQADEGFWCCVGSGLENHGKYGEMIYAHDEKNIYVNLFIPSKLTWKGFELTQENKFPFEQTSRIHVKTENAVAFTVFLRKPSWLQGDMKVMVNGKAFKPVMSGSGFAAIERTWQNGDVIGIALPMKVAVEQLPDRSPWYSFTYGPLVLAAAIDSSKLEGLRADDSRMGHVAAGPLLPVHEAPLLVANVKQLAAAIQPVQGKPLHFSASSVIYPSKYKKLQLIPFYQIHDARYMLYWRVTDKNGLAAIQRETSEKEKAMLALEAITLDQIAPGEQQPEVEHGFKGDRSETGLFNEWHWRNAQGWFSYELKNKNNAAKKLRVTYAGKERNRGFDIYLNDQFFKTVILDGSGGDGFIDVDYDIPAELNKDADGKLVVKFVAKDGQATARVFYVRLLK